MPKTIVHKILFLLFITVSGFAQNKDLELAFTYARQGEYDKAAEIYKKLNSEKQFRQLIHNDYVTTLFKLRDYDTAEKFIKNQISNYPASLVYRADLAELYELTNRKELSVKEYDKLVDEAVGNDSKLFELMNYLNKSKKIELIVKLVLKDREVTKSPYKLDTWLISAYSFLNQKDKMLEEVLSYGFRSGNTNYVKSSIQDNFLTDEEIKFVESVLLAKIQNDPNESFYSDLLIWWYAQKGDFARAFLQARALDKRIAKNGYNVFQLASQSFASKDYKNSVRMYQYIMTEYPEGDLYPFARTFMIKSKEELIKNTYPVETESINDLIAEYNTFINEVGVNIKTAEAIRNMGLLEAFYLNDYTSAIATLEKAIVAAGMNARFRDQCKLDLGDIYLLKDEPWESTLLYLQVEKSQKEDNLAEIAKLKNAKLQYYTAQFSLAKDILDVLKKATSKEISNDAMQLSLLIEDNTGLDTSEVAMARFSKVDLLIFQNKYNEGIELLDSLYNEYKFHSLADEILWLRANTLLKLNRVDLAINDLNEIVESHFEDILADDALFLLAKTTEENLKDTSKAMEYYRRILTDFPGSIYAAQARMRFRELRGDYVN